MGSDWGLIAASLLSVLAACGSRGSPGVSAAADADGFEWTDGGKTTVATDFSYTVSALFDGTTFLFTVRAIAPVGRTCTLLGQFATEVPPPVGTYPVVQILGKIAGASQPDASFGVECEPSARPDGGNVPRPRVERASGPHCVRAGERRGDVLDGRGAVSDRRVGDHGVHRKVNVGCLTPGEPSNVRTALAGHGRHLRRPPRLLRRLAGLHDRVRLRRPARRRRLRTSARREPRGVLPLGLPRSGPGHSVMRCLGCLTWVKTAPAGYDGPEGAVLSAGPDRLS